MRSRLKPVGLCVLGALCLMLCYLIARSILAHTAYQREIAAMRAAHLPSTEAELQVPEPPAGTNAAPVWQRVDALIGHDWYQSSERDVFSPGRYVPYYPGHSVPRNVLPLSIKQMRRALRDRQDIVALVNQALAKPHCVYGYDWTFSQPQKSQHPYPRQDLAMEIGAHVVVADGRVMLADGKPAEAARRIGQTFLISRQINEECPRGEGALCGMWCDILAIDALGDVLLQAGERPGVAQVVGETIASQWRPMRVGRGLAGDFVIVLQGIAEKRDHGGIVVSLGSGDPFAVRAYVDSRSGWQPPGWGGYIEGDGLVLSSSWRKMAESVDRPYPESAKVWRDVQTTLTTQTHRTPNFQYPARIAEVAARAAVTRSAAAVLEYKARRRSFPARLDQAMASVPADPFDLKPLRYRREGPGFVVWSVGETGRFDGGKPGGKPLAYPGLLPAYDPYAMRPIPDVLFRYPGGAGMERAW